MARNRPFDFDDDDLDLSSDSIHETDIGGSRSHDIGAMGDDLLAEANLDDTGQQAGNRAQAQQQTAIQTRSAQDQSDTSTTMRHKRGNQPR
jgi:hypothetical protein